MPMQLPTKQTKKVEKPIVPVIPVQPIVNPIIEPKKDEKQNKDDQENEESKETKSKKRLNLDELLVSLNTDSLIQYCLENPSLKHFNFLKYMIPDNYLPIKIDIPNLGSKSITKRGGGGFSGAVNTTLEIMKEVLKEKSEKKTQKKGEN
jgi:hypothetical protein